MSYDNLWGGQFSVVYELRGNDDKTLEEFLQEIVYMSGISHLFVYCIKHKTTSKLDFYPLCKREDAKPIGDWFFKTSRWTKNYITLSIPSISLKGSYSQAFMFGFMMFETPWKTPCNIQELKDSKEQSILSINESMKPSDKVYSVEIGNM